MNRPSFAITAVAVFALMLGFVAQTQAAVDTETFVVTVDPVLSIQAPANQVDILHDTTNNPQPFGTQAWSVKANNPSGATVSFETDQAFTNDTGPTGVYRRDARLQLSLQAGTGAAWSITDNDSQTDYLNTIEVVSVTAESNGPGSAIFNLNVSFIETSFEDLAAGDYVMTVTGTLSAKP